MASNPKTFLPEVRNNLQEAINNQQSRAPEIKPLGEELVKERERRTCIANGGVWDEETQTCSFPNEPKTDIKTFTSSEKGELSGFTKGGKTFFGANPEEITRAVTAATLKQELPVGEQADVVLSRQEQERQQALQEQGLQQAGQVGVSSDEQLIESLRSQITASEVDYVAALSSGLPNLLPNFIQGAGLGVGAGSLAGKAAKVTPQGRLLGGVFGVLNGVKGYYQDVVRNIKEQKRDIIETPIRTLTETKQQLDKIINAQNANPENYNENREAFNTQLTLIDIEFERLKEETDSNLNKFLGDTGTRQLQEYEVYYTTEGEREQQIREFQLALTNPDPSRIREDSVSLEEIRKYIAKELGGGLNE